MNYTEKDLIEVISKYKKEKKSENVGIYLVGGAVRDKIMGKKNKDKDYCITGISSIEFEKLFPSSKKVGDTFEVYLLSVDGDRETEIALARKEEKFGFGYHGTKAVSDDTITIVDDLIRRDLTMNAMAVDLLTGELIDPFGGEKSIEKEEIDVTSEKFKEDPLRVIRLARFAARYTYKVSQKSINYCQEIKDELTQIKTERYLLELKKASTDNNLVKFFEVLKIVGGMDATYNFLEKNYDGMFKEFDEIDGQLLNGHLEKIDKLINLNEEEKMIKLFSIFDNRKVYKKWKLENEIIKYIYFYKENKFNLENYIKLDNQIKIDLLEKIISCPITKSYSEINKKQKYDWMNKLDNIFENKFQLNEILNDLKIIENVKLDEEDFNLNLKGPEIKKHLTNKRKIKLEKSLN